ncbi:MAG: recombinase family protein [Pedobacter sp.]|uniref:recombinase family protein n=1 Tax=Pedobacter sp. TaxID=1411316 RepID=UPI00356AC772
MKILYVRVSSLDQNTDRQKINEGDFNLLVEDKCSGAITFEEREGGKKILRLLHENYITSLSVVSIDRLGRNLKDLLHTIEQFNNKHVPIFFINQGLRTLDENGKENPISKMIISILGVVGEMERTQIKERQAEGIALAKAKGLFNGRKTGSIEDNLKFLSKPKNAKALDYLKRGNLTNLEISKITGLHINTLTKIKKIGLKPLTSSL